MKSFFMSVVLTGILLPVFAQDPAYPTAPAAPQNINAVEYFVDIDPGIGVATTAAITPGVTIPNVPATVNITGLSNGVHRLFMRSKNNEGEWEVTVMKEFLYDSDPIYILQPAPLNIIAAEYFVDTDPGFGNGTQISLTAGLDLNNVPVTVNVLGLSNGSHQLFIRTKNAEGEWSISLVRAFIVDFDFAYPINPAPQNIIAGEYYIDTDPGFGNATSIVLTPGLDLNNIASVINTIGLSNGAHRLYIRFKNNEGSWSSTNFREFIVNNDPAYPPSPAVSQNIINAEYFINADPGQGNGTGITLSAAPDINNLAVSINTASLTPATTNWLYLRTKNAEGSWSITNIKQFVVAITNDPPYPATPAAAQNITAAEYFLDTDPGYNNGTTIPVTAALDINNIPVAINTASLLPATTHRLYLRTKNTEGSWSIISVRQFSVDITNDPPYSASPAAAQNITAAEYFIDTDPGYNNGTSITVTAALDINNVPVAVNTAALLPATTHWVYLRTKNTEGSWSIASVRQFSVDITSDPVYPPPPPAVQNIVAAEYFINTDPGIGNGTSIPVTASPDINSIAAIINTSSLLPATTNNLFLRTKGTDGKWSITNVKEFIVSITGDPVYPTPPAPPQNITRAEYFLDTDPGIGNGIAIPVTAATNINNLAVTVNTTGLSNGNHRLYIRSRNNEGSWSITNMASFFTNLLSLSADSLVFGNVPVNTSGFRNLIITNNSNVSQTITGVTIAAPYSSDFSGTINIPALGKDTIVVSFTPTVAGAFNQALQLQTSAGNYNVDLRGTGVTQVPSWTISPATGYNYGNIPINTAFNAVFNVQNTGNVPVTLSNVTTNNALFTTNFAPGDIIPVGGNTNVYVLFSPTVVNTYSVLLTIQSSTPGVSNVTTTLTASAYNPGAPPVLQFVAGTPYSATTGVNPVAGQAGNYTYKILYKSANNRPPQTGSPKVSIDLNGDQDFTDLNEGVFAMSQETAGTDYITGIVYAYTYVHLNNTSSAGYRFSATDDNGNAAVSINTNYVSGPVITDQQLDLRIFANNITFSNSNPLPGATFTVFATVSNPTALPAINVPVRFYRDSIFIGSDVIPAVNAYSSATISHTLSFAAEGFYPIKVWIDSSNTLGDINPLNNYAIRPVIVGSPNLPGGITVTATATVQQCPVVRVLMSGTATYFGTGSPTAVAGAEVTINTGTQLITTTTNSSGFYTYLLEGVSCGGSFSYTVSITDFTFTSSLVTNAVSVPCPSPGACVPAPSMGGAFASTSSNPCANIAGTNGGVNIQLQYRQRNLANFWNAFDQIKNDTLKVFQDGVLIQTLVSADYSHGPGNEVTVPVSIPLGSAATVITAELKYVYVEYLQIPSSIYFGNHIPMMHTGAVTITPVPNQPDLSINGYAQTSATSFKFNNVNLKCVAAGSHQVKVYDSIPGGPIVLIQTTSFTTLSPGGTSMISYSDPTITSGTHIIKVVTDSEGTVAETNELNNTFLFTMIVPPSELFITKLSTSPTALNTGSTTSFTATIKNTGRPTGNFNVRFSANGVQVGALKTIASLGENSSIQVVSDAYTVTNSSNACGVIIEAMADATSQVTESDEANNSRQVTLGADLAPYHTSGEQGSASNPVIVRVFETKQFFPAVRNIGERDAENVTVRFTLNSNWIGADTISTVKAGEIYAAHASFTHMFTVAGNYIVKVIADTANSICESNEANNEGNFHIRVVESLPDLEVLSQYISPSSLNPNIAQNITIVGTVKNIGGQVTASSVLRFLVDNIQLGADVPINGLLPGRDTTVAATATYSSIIAGVKVMSIVADPANAITEEREDNNLATRTMIVGDAPDMSRSSVGAITFNPTGFEAGDSVNVNFSITNNGPTFGTAWVKFLIKDTTYATTAIDSVQFSLASGATTIISRRMLFDIDEGYVVTEIYNCNPAEYDLLNNNDTLRFTTVAKMKQAITINGNLDMKQAAPAQFPGWIGGHILMGNYDLTVNGIILNYDSAHFIISNGTGKLKLVNSNALNVYPVGTSDSSMNFVRLNNTGTPDNFSVRVVDYVLSNGTSGDTVLVANTDRTWFIEETIPGGSNASAEFWWHTNSELPGFDRQFCYTGHYVGLWEYGTTGAAVLAANGQYSKMQTGFTSFSPFIVTSAAVATPLSLLSFTAQNRTNDVVLKWRTENEINTASFDVERSADGTRFIKMGSVPAYNTSGIHDYNVTDQQPLNGISYYRLKQIDIDGRFVYSKIIAINRNSKVEITVYPNPVKDKVKIVFASADKQRAMRIVDSKGAVVKHITIQSGETNVEVDMSRFGAGVYMLILGDADERVVQRVVKE